MSDFSGSLTWVVARVLRAPRRAFSIGAIARVMLAGAVVGIAMTGCSGSDSVKPTPIPLSLVASYALSITEPSDLAIDETGTILWTVTNSRPDSVYQLDLTGKRVKTLKYAGEDLEGIAYDRSDRTLWVAEENRRQIVHLDLDGNVLSKHRIGLTGEQNSGLEGISLNDGGRIFVLNEKNPGLYIQLDSTQSIATIDTLTFAKDYSGLSYDAPSASFWIVSDASKRLYLWNKTRGVTKEYVLPYTKAEGVAIDPATSTIYIVSDFDNTLYVYHYLR